MDKDESKSFARAVAAVAATKPDAEDTLPGIAPARVPDAPRPGGVVGADGKWRKSEIGAGGFERIEGDSAEYTVTDNEGQRVVVLGADGEVRVARILRGR